MKVERSPLLPPRWKQFCTQWGGGSGQWHTEAVSTYQSPSLQIHHEVEDFQEVGPQYGESHGCLQKTSREPLATGGEGLLAAAPAQQRCAVSCHDGWPRSCCRTVDW